MSKKNPLFCPYCGHMILDDKQKYCLFCGSRIKPKETRDKKAETNPPGCLGVILFFALLILLLIASK